MKSLIKKTGLFLSLLGMGLFGASALQASSTLSQPAQVVSAHSFTSTTSAQINHGYWAKRIDKYAASRKAYHYPQITNPTMDLGGTKTANGKAMIKPHMLYRSANLYLLSRKSAKEVKHLNIHNDIDLRAPYGPDDSINTEPQPGENRQTPDKYKIRMHYHVFPVENTREEVYSWPIRERLGEVYRFGLWYSTSITARQAYRNAIMYMINPKTKGPILINCSQGRDRTGCLVAILEGLLGVSKWNIFNNFLLVNYYVPQSSYSDQAKRMQKFYSVIDKKYGSMNNYYHKGLKLSNHDIQRLRKKYLVQI